VRALEERSVAGARAASRGPAAPLDGAAGPGPTADGSSTPFRLGYRPQLDGVRGLAVLLVLTYHVGAVLWRPARLWLAPGGILGLDVFFVLSGFLITCLLLSEADRRGSVALGAFAGRRLRRLVPVMVALFAFLLTIAFAGKMYEPAAILRSVPTVFTFSHNWAVALGWDVSVGHLWSVALEAQFYLVWALVVALAVRCRRPYHALATVAGVGVLAVLVGRSLAMSGGTPLLQLYMGTIWRFDSPLVGALVGVVASAGWLPWFRGRLAVGAGLVGLAVLSVGVAVFQLGDSTLYHGGFTVAALCVGAIVLGAVREPPSVLGRLLALRPLAVVGLVSYSLYVWHLPLFEILAKNTGGWSPPVRAIVGVVLALVVATASYLVIERPFLRHRRRATQPVP
jgi:peptidoglycan/LPS O-acetylase OafA/YrhL